MTPGGERFWDSAKSKEIRLFTIEAVLERFPDARFDESILDDPTTHPLKDKHGALYKCWYYDRHLQIENDCNCSLAAINAHQLWHFAHIRHGDAIARADARVQKDDHP